MCVIIRGITVAIQFVYCLLVTLLVGQVNRSFNNELQLNCISYCVVYCCYLLIDVCVIIRGITVAIQFVYCLLVTLLVGQVNRSFNNLLQLNCIS